jgi:diadenosine tetraphosphate (Ap4A) HIT family hydrolase
MNMQHCAICERILLIKKNKNPFFIKELKSSYVVLGDHQFYKGYTLLLSKVHTDELYHLESNERTQFLEDMAIVSEAVYKVFKPKKLNYELLGNTDSHLHWHIIPRYSDDPKPDVPIWIISRSIRCAESTVPSEKELKSMKERFILELNKLLGSKS